MKKEFIIVYDFCRISPVRLRTGSINGKEIFRVSNGVRVVTDWNGKVTKIINIKGELLNVDYSIAGKQKTVKLKSNQVYKLKTESC